MRLLRISLLEAVRPYSTSTDWTATRCWNQCRYGHRVQPPGCSCGKDPNPKLPQSFKVKERNLSNPHKWKSETIKSTPNTFKRQLKYFFLDAQYWKHNSCEGGQITHPWDFISLVIFSLHNRKWLRFWFYGFSIELNSDDQIFFCYKLFSYAYYRNNYPYVVCFWVHCVLKSINKNDSPSSFLNSLNPGDIISKGNTCFKEL